jgi:hypothetical protein
MTPKTAAILAVHGITKGAALAGDVNLFLGRNSEDPEEAELSIMIAE